MQTFNVEAFEAHKTNNEVMTKTQDGGWVRQVESPNEFIEESGNNDSPFTDYAAFFKATGGVKITGKKFYGFEIGIWTEYDNAGKIVKTSDHDKHYPFSIYDLDKEMTKDFNIDIMHRHTKAVVIRDYDAVYFYTVSIALNGVGKGDHRIIKVNGVTGAIISDQIIPYMK